MNETRQDKLLGAYRGFLRHLREAWHQSEGRVRDRLQQALAQAEDKTAGLSELSREELEQLGDWLRRDLRGAAEFFDRNGEALARWLGLELTLAEYELADLVAAAADPTLVQLHALRQQAELGAWHTGEITGPGTLVCDRCGETLHYEEPGHVPPCPKCRGTVFHKEYPAP